MKKRPAVYIAHIVAGVVRIGTHGRQPVFGATIGDARRAYTSLSRRILVV